jgi:Protein of unknown function (DUF4232)
MGRHHRAYLPVLATAAVAVFAVGCGSSGSNAGGSGSSDTSKTIQDTGSTVKSAPNSEKSDTSGTDTDKGTGTGTKDQSKQGTNAQPKAKSAATPWCGTDQLSLKLRSLSPGAGNRYAAAVLTNTSASSCRTQGYIGMQLLNGSGKNVPTKVVRDKSKTSTQLTLASGASAWARLHWGAVAGTGDSDGANCQPAASSVEITPPDSYTQEKSTWSFGSVCEAGRVDVLPLASGSGPSS